jgi:hypothetical protein
MKHLQKFATDVAVLSIGILAGVQVALPLLQDADVHDVLARSSMSNWTAAIPAIQPPVMEGMPETMLDAKDVQIQELSRQLAEAQALIQELQRQLTEGVQSANAPIPTPMDGQEMPIDPWVASPIAPASDDGNFLCRMLGIGC